MLFGYLACNNSDCTAKLLFFTCGDSRQVEERSRAVLVLHAQPSMLLCWAINASFTWQGFTFWTLQRLCLFLFNRGLPIGPCWRCAYPWTTQLLPGLRLCQLYRSGSPKGVGDTAENWFTSKVLRTQQWEMMSTHQNLLIFFCYYLFILILLINLPFIWHHHYFLHIFVGVGVSAIKMTISKHLLSREKKVPVPIPSHRSSKWPGKGRRFIVDPAVPILIYRLWKAGFPKGCPEDGDTKIASPFSSLASRDSLPACDSILSLCKTGRAILDFRRG